MRILVIKLSSLGDLFHALPAVHMIKKQLNCHIDWVTQTEYAGLVECFPDVDNVIIFPRRSFLKDARLFIAKLRFRRYDCVIDMQGLLKSALLVSVARTGRSIGPSFHREGARVFYSEVAGKREKNRHAVEKNLDFVSHLGLQIDEVKFPVEFPDANVQGRQPRVVFVPCSRWRTKNWPPECFVAVGARLQKTLNASIFLIGSGEDRKICEQIRRNLPQPSFNLAGKQSLVETGGMLKKADLLISNDSGPIHMAAALGIRVLALFGPTDPRRTGPYGQNHRVMVSSEECSPCFSRTCRRGNVACLKGITPEKVGEAAIEILT